LDLYVGRQAALSVAVDGLYVDSQQFLDFLRRQEFIAINARPMLDGLLEKGSRAVMTMMKEYNAVERACHISNVQRDHPVKS
jgi:hypothetical protein